MAQNRAGKSPAKRLNRVGHPALIFRCASRPFHAGHGLRGHRQEADFSSQRAEHQVYRSRRSGADQRSQILCRQGSRAQNVFLVAWISLRR